MEILQNQKGAVLEKASETVIGDGNIPFLPVIPRSFRSLYDLMAMVRNGSKVGYIYLNPTQISDVVDAPQEPYYIYDVEDGNATRDKSPQDAEKILKSQKRSPLTAAEVTALCTHTDVLSKHYVWATGSRCGSAGRVPDAYLGRGDRPRLGWDYVGSSSGHCGGRPLAVVARTSDLGPSGLLVLWSLASAAIFSTGRVKRPQTPLRGNGADTTRAVRCATHDLPLLFAQKSDELNSLPTLTGNAPVGRLSLIVHLWTDSNISCNFC